MPNEITKHPDGKITAKLETGEIFEGDPLEVTQKMAEAHVSTKRWGQEWKHKAETPPVQQPPTQQQPVVDQNEAQLQNYLLTQTAKALGYENADQYKADLARVKGTTEKVNNQLVATEFLALNQDFPNTPEAIESLSKKIDEMHWDFNTQSMTAAHALLVREHAADDKKGYAPLTAEQINSAWANNMQQASRTAPPPMIHGTSPDANRANVNEPWNMKMDELRAAAIKQQLEPQR
jgi:hypothetical protein